MANNRTNPKKKPVSRTQLGSKGLFAKYGRVAVNNLLRMAQKHGTGPLRSAFVVGAKGPAKKPLVKKVVPLRK